MRFIFVDHPQKRRYHKRGDGDEIVALGMSAKSIACDCQLARARVPCKLTK